MGLSEDVFGDDYLYFYEPVLTPERSEREAELAWRILGLERGAKVLDLACGHGRIGNRLAQRGARVTGLDADPLFLARAREDATARGVEVGYVHGDMRSLPQEWTAAFDAVLLWFTAFGYFDDAGNRAVLDEVRRVLRPGGRFALELNHLPWILRHHQRQSFVRRGADVMLDETTWNPAESVMATQRTVIRAGVVREVPYSVRMYMPAELIALLREAGFQHVEALGPGGEPLAIEDRRLVMYARRGARAALAGQ